MALGSTVLWKLAGNRIHRRLAYILMKHTDGYSSKIKADIWSPAAKNWGRCPGAGASAHWCSVFFARDENILRLDGDRSVSAPQTLKTLICAFLVGECRTLRVISVELCSSQNLYIYFNQIFFNQSLLGKKFKQTFVLGTQSPENVHAHSMVQTEHSIFKNIYMYRHMHTCGK